MASYTGGNKNVSSSYLFSTLQSFYTKIKTLLAGKSDINHTHNYAGSSSAGGAATTALKCTGDSDTLDGYHGSSYFFTYGNYGVNYFGSTDINTWTRSGCYAIQSGCTNTPTERGEDVWGTILIVQGLSDRISQYAIFWNETGQPLWHRCLNGSSWTSWSRVRDGGNSDTVDGCHAYQMQTLDANGGNHGSAWLMQVRHNVDNDGYFKLFCGDGSVGTKVDFANTSNTSSSSSRANALSSTGFGKDNLTYCQTSGDFYGNTGWCHYLIANHMDGATY